MTTYNLLPHKIRVLANTAQYSGPKKHIPIEVEGTCITLETYGSTYYDEEIKAGNILDVLFSEPEDDIEVCIRWDNDTKIHMPPGNIIHRSSAISKCMSIWLQNPQDGLYTDDRPYYDLKPRYYSKGKRNQDKFLHYAIKNITTTINTEQMDDRADNNDIFEGVNMIPTGPPIERIRDSQGKITTKRKYFSDKKKPHKQSIKTTSIPLTIFKNIDDIPINYSNAAIRDTEGVWKVTKYIGSDGQTIVKTVRINKGDSYGKQTQYSTPIRGTKLVMTNGLSSPRSSSSCKSTYSSPPFHIETYTNKMLDNIKEKTNEFKDTIGTIEPRSRVANLGHWTPNELKSSKFREELSGKTKTISCKNHYTPPTWGSNVEDEF